MDTTDEGNCAKLEERSAADPIKLGDMAVVDFGDSWVPAGIQVPGFCF